MKIIINDKCSGCKLCLKSCPYGAIDMVGERAALNYRCTMCGACLNICKIDAIELADKIQRSAQMPIDHYTDVWVFVEVINGAVAEVSKELICKGRQLADDLGEKLIAVIIGSGLQKLAEDALRYGPDEVVIVSKTVLKDKDEETYTDALERLVKKDHPGIILAGASPFGRSLIPKLATRLETGLTADCTELSIDKKKRLLRQTRPAFGGNIMATIICEDRRPQMATVRPHVFKAAPVAKPAGKIRTEKLTGFEPASRIEHQDLLRAVADYINLADAEIIVAGGRGLKNSEGFALIRQLAEQLGAGVGASRAAVDSGWIEYPHQVGQTGKTVSPKIYIACGISGAVQHLAGMQTSECIIAINKDPNAPIFEVAHYGVVGDLYQVVPELIKTIRKVRSGSTDSGKSQ